MGGGGGGGGGGGSDGGGGSFGGHTRGSPNRVFLCVASPARYLINREHNVERC